MEVEEEEEEETETKPDPLHQLILHFSRTALTEKMWESGFSCNSPLIIRSLRETCFILLCVFSLQETWRWPSLYVLCWYYGKGKTVSEQHLQTAWMLIALHSRPVTYIFHLSRGRTMKRENGNCKGGKCKYYVNVWLLNLLSSISLQSCHMCEENEGGNQEGDEPSFEVRQTEMVWGGPGEGRRGESAKKQLPTHWVTTPRQHTRHYPPPQIFSFFPIFSLDHSHHLSISCCGGLTCACLCWTLLTTWFNVVDLTF